jgi:hypothetical protein
MSINRDAYGTAKTFKVRFTAWQPCFSIIAFLCPAAVATAAVPNAWSFHSFFLLPVAAKSTEFGVDTFAQIYHSLTMVNMNMMCTSLIIMLTKHSRSVSVFAIMSTLSSNFFLPLLLS